VKRTSFGSFWIDVIPLREFLSILSQPDGVVHERVNVHKSIGHERNASLMPWTEAGVGQEEYCFRRLPGINRSECGTPECERSLRSVIE